VALALGISSALSIPLAVWVFLKCWFDGQHGPNSVRGTNCTGLPADLDLVLVALWKMTLCSKFASLAWDCCRSH